MIASVTGREGLLIAVNLAIAAMTFASWLSMVLGSGSDGSLSLRGLGSLKYYTILSNLLSGLASTWFALCLLVGANQGPALLAKYAATVSVMVTFLVTLFFLTPSFGFAALYRGPNFLLHLVLPLMALFEFCVLEPRLGLSLGDSLVAAVPTLAYAVCYYGNILVNGVGEKPHSNDWYGFTVWGVERMPVVFVVMIVITWVLALGVMAFNGFFGS